MWKKFLERYNRENDRQLPYEASKILFINCECYLSSRRDCPAFIHNCICYICEYKCLAYIHWCICTPWSYREEKCKADNHSTRTGFKKIINVLDYYTFYNLGCSGFTVIYHCDLVIHFTKYIIKLIAIIRNLSSTLPNLVIIEIIKNLISELPLCIYFDRFINELTVNYLSDYEINELICYAKIRPIVAENTFENIYNLVDTFDYNYRLTLIA